MDSIQLLAKAILTFPEAQAKSIAKELLRGVQTLRDKQEIGDEDVNNFRRSFNRAIRKELNMLFQPDFTKVEKNHLENNRRFFALLEQEKTVDIVVSIHDPYRGFENASEEGHTYYDLFQIADPAGELISIPVPVFAELIGNEEEEIWNNRINVRAFLESNGIYIRAVRKRAGLEEDWGFSNALWNNDRFALCYFRGHPKGHCPEQKFFMVFDLEERYVGKLLVEKEDEVLSSEDRKTIGIWLEYADEYAEVNTASDVLDIVSSYFRN